MKSGVLCGVSSFHLCLCLTVWLAEDCHFAPNAPTSHLWVPHDHNLQNLHKLFLVPKILKAEINVTSLFSPVPQKVSWGPMTKICIFLVPKMPKSAEIFCFSKCPKKPMTKICICFRLQMSKNATTAKKQLIFPQMHRQKKPTRQVFGYTSFISKT